MSRIYSASQIFYSMIYHSILKPEMERMDKLDADIVRRNVALGASSLAIHNSDVVIAPIGYMKGAKSSPLMSDTLKAEFDEIQKQRKDFAVDRTYIKNCTSFIVENVSGYQDMRDVLSDSIARYIPELSIYSRVNMPYFTIHDKPVLLKQWKKAEDLLEMYLACRLLT